jgi:hypothetical protein
MKIRVKDIKQVKKISLIGLIFLICIQSTCKKNSNCTETSYSFEAYAKVINPYDSITVGDTIWLEIIAPIAQVDRINGQTVTFSNAENLGTAIGFAEIILPEIKGAANDFDYVLVKGTTVSNPKVTEIREYSFIEGSANYEFRLGIIPKRKGFFNFGLSNAANVFRKNDKCTKAFYRIYFTQTPLHLYYLKQVLGITPDSTYASPYCFKVK